MNVTHSEEHEREGRLGAEQFPHASETEERIAADRRGRRSRKLAKGKPTLNRVPADGSLVNPAVAALCEAVRDYAIFFMNADGVIVYWGMGAHLVKWWTDDEAIGAHLRLLYPEGGSEDGTAEEHLLEAAASGEYVGEGQRVRRGGSTFWAHTSLTALRDPRGKLLGFAKVTQDLTKRRATEAAVALANEAQTTREAALATAKEAQLARERAEEARVRAEAARERAEEAALVARDQVRNAQEHIARILRPALETAKAGRVAIDVKLDAYVKLFAEGEIEEKDPGSENKETRRE